MRKKLLKLVIFTWQLMRIISIVIESDKVWYFKGGFSKIKKYVLKDQIMLFLISAKNMCQANLFKKIFIIANRKSSFS